ncbi:hypothetical protein T439DRAFT_57257 [Meredithblackwellia eburnea MCA 4105]
MASVNGTNESPSSSVGSPSTLTSSPTSGTRRKRAATLVTSPLMLDSISEPTPTNTFSKPTHGPRARIARNSSFKLRSRHRHSDVAEAALTLLQTLAEQLGLWRPPLCMGVRRGEVKRNKAFELMKPYPTLEASILSKGAGPWRTSQRQCEAWVQGLWDPRFDSLNSSVVETLSATDQLTKLNIRGSFPVGDRDACFVSTHFEDDLGEENPTCYVAARSVEDPLVPKKGMRTTIHLNGYCIRSVSRPPAFFPPPPSPEMEPAPLPVRPLHRRAKSSVSALVNGIPSTPGLSKRPSFHASATAPPLPSSRPPSIHQRNASGSSFRPELTHHLSYGPQPTLPPLPFEYSLSKGEPLTNSSVEQPQVPGVWISFIARSSPGGNLPQTYVNQLALSLPLGLSRIDRYLHSHGFPPYVERKHQRGGLDILDEHYDAAGGRFRLVYRINECIANEDTRIRFFGSSFSRGNFCIEVLRAKDWRIEYDVKPEEDPVLTKEEHHDDHLGPIGSHPLMARRKSSLSVVTSLSSPPRTPRMPSSAQTFTFPLKTPRPAPKPLEVATDSAKLPGAAGGITLIIPNKDVAGGMPVTVTISKKADGAGTSLESIMGGAFGKAAALGLDGTHSETIEQLLGNAADEAEMALQGARAVLKQLREGCAEEEERSRLGKNSRTPSVMDLSVRDDLFGRS